MQTRVERRRRGHEGARALPMKGPTKSSRMCPTSNSQTASFSPLPPLLPHLCCEGGRHVTGHLLVHQGNQLDAWKGEARGSVCVCVGWGGGRGGEGVGQGGGKEGSAMADEGAKRTASIHQQTRLNISLYCLPTVQPAHCYSLPIVLLTLHERLRNVGLVRQQPLAQPQHGHDRLLH